MNKKAECSEPLRYFLLFAFAFICRKESTPPAAAVTNNVADEERAATAASPATPPPRVSKQRDHPLAPLIAVDSDDYVSKALKVAQSCQVLPSSLSSPQNTSLVLRPSSFPVFLAYYFFFYFSPAHSLVSAISLSYLFLSCMHVRVVPN